MRLDIFLEFGPDESRSHASVFENGFQLVEHAEELGFESVWIPDLPLRPERSLSFAPFTIASALAARTSRIRIGTAVLVLPIHQPCRLAVDALALQMISNGRIELGFGSGADQNTLSKFGIPSAHRHSIYARKLDEYLQNIDQYNNSIIEIGGGQLSVAPLPIRLACSSPDSFDFAASKEIPVLVDVSITGNRNIMKKMIKDYKKRVKTSGSPSVIGRLPAFVAPSLELAIKRSIRSMEKYLFHRSKNNTIENLTASELQKHALVGSPWRVYSHIKRITSELSLDALILEINPGNSIRHEHVRESMQLIAAASQGES